ncbi:hypothetical protein GCM10010365_14230 [Streptomyces poonensis]|uniref:DUF397 domain-containing protein n=1 Tax=Streptomyces poonensis TaxID=68255 RepID=A0A918UEM0_9ACTN|nr:DUF397 domain-containing protein [Streptomyces poonensis]GGY96404.1 hypothetical protein GCM10010365_14230 [Streptomyces poonensis]GLJ88954.1 hypothetical protein GCM10017589_15540 [Streptomyces poonensis]
MPTPAWQKSSYCGEGESCVHIARTWQKSAHCSEGEACVQVAATPHPTIHLTESADPTRTVLTTTPHAFHSLLRTLKKERHRG